MGGGSSSNKSSNTTNNVDESINLNQGGFVAQNGSITITDSGAIENAFEFGSLAIEQSFEFADNSLAAISKSNTQSVSAVKELAENLKANETSMSQKLDSYLVYGVIALIIIVLIIILKGRK